MDIGQVTHRYRPSIGGIENYVHRLNESLRARGDTTRTFTTDLSLDGGAPVEDERVVYGRTTVAPMRNPLSVEQYRAVRESDCDVYHLHNLWFLATVAGARAVPADAPTVLTVHSAEIANNSSLVRALNAAYRPLAQYVLDSVDHSFVQGETERGRLLERFDVDPETVSVVPNGIVPEQCDVTEERVTAFHEEYGLDPSVPTLLYVSRLVPEKNPGVLVDAVTDHLAGRDLQAVVVGDGDSGFVAPLRSRADDRVTFLSGLPDQDLQAAYHAADIFAFLGTWEGLPTVVLEAMNARLPVVSTPVGAVPDAVHDPANGRLLSTPPTAAGLAAAVRHYLDRPDERAAVGERNRERVRAEYAWEGVAETIAARYDALR